MSCECGCHDKFAPRTKIGKCINCGCERKKMKEEIIDSPEEVEKKK